MSLVYGRFAPTLAVTDISRGLRFYLLGFVFADPDGNRIDVDERL